MSNPNYRISDHAREEANRRGIPLTMLEAVMESPGQIVDTYDDRKVYQSRMTINGKLYVVRAIVEPGDPLTVVTVYRTSQIEKYWHKVED